MAPQSSSKPQTGTLMPVNNDPGFAGLYRVTTYEDFFEKRKANDDKSSNGRPSDNDKAED